MLILMLVTAVSAHDHDHTVHDDARLLLSGGGFGPGPALQSTSLGDSDWTFGGNVGLLGVGAWARYTPYCSASGFCFYAQFGPSMRVSHTRGLPDTPSEFANFSPADLATMYTRGEVEFGSLAGGGLSVLRPWSRWGWDLWLWRGAEFNPYREDIDDVYGASAAIVLRLGAPGPDVRVKD